MGLAVEMTALKNGLASWAKELERFREHAVEGFADHVRPERGKRAQPVNAAEYLRRTVDEYHAMVRKCEGMKEGVDMAFMMVSFWLFILGMIRYEG